jgi:hypothetical protein
MNIKHSVVQEGPIHHVVVRRGNLQWLQIVTSFFDRERAESYAEIEDDIAVVPNEQRTDVIAAKVPTDKEPASAVKPSNFRPAAPSAIDHLKAGDFISVTFSPATAPQTTAENSEEYSSHDHPQMLDARVPVASPAPVRTETAKPGHSGANGSAGEAIPTPSESGSPRASTAAPTRAAPTQVATPAQPAAEESAAGTNSNPGSSGVGPSPIAPAQKAAPAVPAEPAAVERAAGPSPKPTNKAFGDGLAAAHVEPPKTKPVTSTLPTARDPLLARDIGIPISGKALAAEEHHGSLGQQLADRILADMPALMKDHPRGPIRADLADRYRVPPARVNEAVISLFARKKVRLERFDGTEQHIVPPDFEMAPTVSVSTKQKADALALIQSTAKDGLSTLSLAEIAAQAGIPRGSINYVVGRLVNDGALVLVKPGHSNASPIYRVLTPTHAGA